MFIHLIDISLGWLTKCVHVDIQILSVMYDEDQIQSLHHNGSPNIIVHRVTDLMNVYVKALNVFKLHRVYKQCIHVLYQFQSVNQRVNN